MTTKMFGYKDVEQYYADANLIEKMHKIKVPTLMLSAADDPFSPLIGRSWGWLGSGVRTSWGWGRGEV